MIGEVMHTVDAGCTQGLSGGLSHRRHRNRARRRRVAALGALCAGLGLAFPAHAYLDPGTGSILLQGLLAAIAGGIVTAKLYWHRLTALFQGKPKPLSPVDDERHDELGPADREVKR